MFPVACIAAATRRRPSGDFIPPDEPDEWEMTFEPNTFPVHLAPGEFYDDVITITGPAGTATITMPTLPEGWTVEYDTNPLTVPGSTGRRVTRPA